VKLSGRFTPNKINDLTGESVADFDMTKDGFAFIAMGFTGAKAAIFKERYIEQFNKMEAALHALPDNQILRQSLAEVTQAIATLKTEVASSLSTTIWRATNFVTPLTPRRKGVIVIDGTSIEALGFDSPDSFGARTAPSQARFFYGRRMGDIREDVPVSKARVCQPLCVCRQILDRISGRQGSSFGDLS